MSNSKYDWETKLPKMIELYKTGISIPEIYKQIQDDDQGFTPGLSIVYSKFRASGYPTNPAKRTKFLKSLGSVTWSSELVEIPQNPSRQVSRQPPAGLSVSSSNTSNTNVTTNLQTFLTYPVETSLPYRLEVVNDCVPEGTIPAKTFDQGQDQDLVLDSFEDFSFIDMGLEYQEVQDHNFNDFKDSQWSDPQPLENIDGDQNTKWQSAHSESETIKPFDGSMYSSNMTSPDNRFVQPSTLIETDTQLSSDLGMPDGPPVPPSKAQRFVAWIIPKPRYNRSCTPENRKSSASTASTRDSGYGSGRNSPFPSITESVHLSSSKEFHGLYRVPCSVLHQSKDHLKDVPTCPQCHYSGIHNLSWSALELKLEVFKAETKLQGFGGKNKVYDFTAVDAAGNSGLHYAAAAGAGWDVCSALVHSGVDPYRINTAGQLFLHCLRPSTNTPDWDKNTDTVEFQLELINFLNSLQLFVGKCAFRWRDNEGRTALDSYALQIQDKNLRELTLRSVKDAGYPVSTHFSNSPSSSDSFTSSQEKQDKAYQILGRASVEPSYVDAETGDNVLHALARLKLPERGSLLSKIQDFVSQDIDLNLHNKDRDCPLAAFIRERPFQGIESDETGATMSKYLDALLWKDSRRRIPNKINVNLRNHAGATALYYAATRARPDSVRSLIEAGANVNARLDVDGQRISILQATHNARANAVLEKNELKIHQFNNVISYLEHENAVADPTTSEERSLTANSVRSMRCERLGLLEVGALRKCRCSK